MRLQKNLPLQLNLLHITFADIVRFQEFKWHMLVSFSAGLAWLTFPLSFFFSSPNTYANTCQNCVPSSSDGEHSSYYCNYNIIRFVKIIFPEEYSQPLLGLNPIFCLFSQTDLCKTFFSLHFQLLLLQVKMFGNLLPINPSK